MFQATRERYFFWEYVIFCAQKCDSLHTPFCKKKENNIIPFVSQRFFVDTKPGEMNSSLETEERINMSTLLEESIYLIDELSKRISEFEEEHALLLESYNKLVGRINSHVQRTIDTTQTFVRASFLNLLSSPYSGD